MRGVSSADRGARGASRSASGSGMTRMSPSRAAPVALAASVKRVASAIEPACATSRSTQARPLPRAKVGTDRSSFSPTSAATAETKALPTMLPDSMSALSAMPPHGVAQVCGRSERATRRRGAARMGPRPPSASRSGSARRRSPVERPLEPHAHGDEVLARGRRGTRRSRPPPRRPTPRARPSRSAAPASLPSAVIAWPQPMVASSCRASSSRGRSDVVPRHGSLGTSRMNTGRPLPSTVTAESPGHQLERLAERLQHRLVLPEERVHRQPDAGPRPRRRPRRSRARQPARRGSRAAGRGRAPAPARRRAASTGVAAAPLEPRERHLRGAVHLGDRQRRAPPRRRAPAARLPPPR